MRLCDGFAEGAPSVSKRRCEAARRLVERDLSRPVSISDMARAAGLSESHLHRCFLRHCGTTPHRFLLDTRLARARELLRDTTLSVKEIAARCGFPDAPSFGRAFRNRAGVSPGAWRSGAAPSVCAAAGMIPQRERKFFV